MPDSFIEQVDSDLASYAPLIGFGERKTKCQGCLMNMKFFIDLDLVSVMHKGHQVLDTSEFIGFLKDLQLTTTKIVASKFYLLPEERFNFLDNYYRELRDTISNHKNAASNVNTISNSKQNFSSSINNAFRNFHTIQTIASILYLSNQIKVVEEINENFDKCLTEIQKKNTLNEVKSNELIQNNKLFQDGLEKQQIRMDELLAILNDHADLKELRNEAKSFELSMKNFNDIGNRWLRTSIAIIVIIFGIIICSFFHCPGFNLNNDHGLDIQKASSSAAALFFLSTIAAWTIRNHRRNAHNKIVAQHRRNTLSSFMRLYRNLGADNEAKAAIIAKSLDAIYSPIPTGYAAEDTTGEGIGATQIVEVVKSVKGT